MNRKKWSADMLEIIKSGHLDEMKAWYNAGGRVKTEAVADKIIPFKFLSLHLFTDCRGRYGESG